VLRAFAAAAFALAVAPALAHADPSSPTTLAQPRRMAVGFQLDAFPTVISAVNGRLGYAPQVWVGIDRVRLRLVGAHLEPPNALAFAPEGFVHPTTTALAAVIDYTFGPRFDGPWVGAGFEQWHRTVEHEGVAGRASFDSVIFTLGGGYIWRVAGNFYLDPWLAAHATLNPETVALGTFSYKPFPLAVAGSVKIGYFIDL
jgi:hypothetical protein